MEFIFEFPVTAIATSETTPVLIQTVSGEYCLPLFTDRDLATRFYDGAKLEGEVQLAAFPDAASLLRWLRKLDNHEPQITHIAFDSAGTSTMRWCGPIGDFTESLERGRGTIDDSPASH